MAIPANPHITKPILSHDNYDFYKNFLYILVFIYALAKITNMAQTFLDKRSRHKTYMPEVETEREASETINDLQDQQENLKWKINKLEKQNDEIKFKIKNVVDNLAATPTDLEEKVQTIFINNKHIHLNHPVYVNQNAGINMEVEEDNCQQANIWGKYMELKKSMPYKSNETISPNMPVIMSSEELENIKAIF